MESVEGLLHSVNFQGKPEYETIAKKFESFHSNHSLKLRNKNGKNQIIYRIYAHRENSCVQNPPNRLPLNSTLSTPLYIPSLIVIETSLKLYECNSSAITA
ncbi:hypothetical protein MTR_3g080555 [Medicago truncatula]|uniref:Uncharacterized protein n=1 Tax=Medicago truncatula TaxID=3880 RepID=A0A072UZA8_MEDTR|nr:hypothetical protein MTR_3g080555 [Medicago truncatula]